jgi:CubicO group peptidase (beta-lactamase class C family)
MIALDQIAGWPGASAAAAITNAHATIADAGALDRPHAWASVTKLLTAYCVLQLVETGDIELDEPAGPAGSTVRHLLSHASGLGSESATVLARPGRRRIYSNAGYGVLGSLVAERAARPFAEQLAIGVLEPLRMTATTISEATPGAVDEAAAAGASGPLADLVRFARELLAPTLISAETLAEATTVSFPGLDGILPGFGRHSPNDWGLGFEIRDDKDPHWTGRTNAPATFGHFGQSGSFLWVDPTRSLACVALAGAPFGPWAAQAWPTFSDAVIAEQARPQ